MSLDDKKLFWHDPYLTRLNTHITHMDGNEVAVAETIFYAFPGRQKNNTETIASKFVSKAPLMGFAMQIA